MLRDECDAPHNLLDVLSVGSRSGFLRSGSGRVEDIVAAINGIKSDAEVWLRRAARCDRGGSCSVTTW